MPVTQLIYASRPFGFDASVLGAILVTARARNAKADVTGALICRRDLYLQLLEGPEAAVTSIYRSIRGDDRHVEVNELLRHEAPSRMFGAWAMLDDPARSWLWSQPEVDEGALTRASKADILGVFARVAKAAGQAAPDPAAT